MKLQDIKNEWSKYIILKDQQAMDIIFAALVGNALIQRDPLWLMIVAPSSGGKSTLIAPCNGIQGVHFVDDLTEKTFLSGYKVKGKETSLLKVIGSGIMCFSDFTSILSKNQNSKNEILGQLRLVFDGNFTKRTGTGEIKWAGKIGFIGASTPDIYQVLEGARSMGERYLYYWLDQPTDMDIVQKQSAVNMSARDIADAMHPLYSEYMHELHAYTSKNGIPPLRMSAEQNQRVWDAAIFCVAAKATIRTDFKSGKPDAIVSKPGVGRDSKMFNVCLQALQTMRAYETNDFAADVTDEMVRIVEKCAWSSVGRERRKVLEILTTYDTFMTASEIGSSDSFGLPKEGVEKYLHALHAVGLIQMDKRGNAFAWGIASDDTKKFVSSVAGITDTKELVRTEADEVEKTFAEF